MISLNNCATTVFGFIDFYKNRLLANEYEKKFGWYKKKHYN